MPQILNPGPRTQDQGPRTRDFGPRTQNPVPGTQNLGLPLIFSTQMNPTSLFLFLCICICAGCTPSLSPLFRDYEIDERDDTVVERIERALEEAGWELTEASAPNAIRTDFKTLNRRLIYKTIVALEVVPIEDRYVRVFIHPYRDNLIGGRAKIPYLPSNIRRRVVPPLAEALEREGLFTPGYTPADSLAEVDR